MTKVSLLTLLLLLFTASQAQAQACTPNPAFTGEGVYPDSAMGMREGCAGAPYSETFTIRVPLDTVISGFTFTFTSMSVTGVSGLPAGFSYACNPASCTIPGGQVGCAIVTGNPTAAQVGTHPLVISFSAVVFNPIFGTQTIPYTNSDYRIIIHPAASPSISPGGTPVIACSAGAVTLDAGAFDSYQWYQNGGLLTNDTLQTYAPATSGLYSVVVTDANGCNGADTMDVLVGPGITFNPAVVDAACGVSDGEASANPTGLAPFTFMWNTVPPQTTDTATLLAAGNYTVVVTDSLGCIDSTVVSVSNLGGPALDSIVAIDADCFGASTGSVDLYHSGGTSPFTYLWSNTQVTQSISGLAAGSYSVTVTDGNNCLLVANATVNEPAQLTGSVSATDETVGMSNGTATVTPSGGTAPYTYAWSNSGNTATITGLIAGNYDVTVTDANGCTFNGSTTVGSIASSLAGMMQGEWLTVFPNPATDQVNVRLNQPGAVTLRLVDVQGRILHEVQMNGSYAQFSVAEWPAGMYFIVASRADGNAQFRLIKQ